ncbi:MAG: hypothetical protein A370_05741 [Clostridium sp. Maddingley MBC34-26]|nr:MAG: hypothetical protein A370_05741 [Clostridium sp. Maddingley MBC34-26]
MKYKQKFTLHELMKKTVKDIERKKAIRKRRSKTSINA